MESKAGKRLDSNNLNVGFYPVVVLLLCFPAIVRKTSDTKVETTQL
jgi:hypothetical protein